MAWSRSLIVLLLIILGAQIELPTNEFAQFDTISRDFINYSYQAPPLSSVHASYKFNASSKLDHCKQTLLPQIIGFKSFVRTPEYYLKIYDQFKPRDFYLII